MDGKGSVSDYRSLLDKTLASHDLTNEEIVHTLVKDQILQTLESQQEYSERAVERRSREVFKFLNELRSASSNDSNSGWKVKQDTEEFRVMYREGPEGTPFHTLLAEGFVDGPVDVCLCISCDSDLYEKWWPQIVVPTFKVTASQCVKKVIVGEQISIVRMKLSWPLSGREALVHYFAFEYFQDGLIVVLVDSISDSDTIDRCTHGFTREGIPNSQGVVRMDLYGGFALKKVTADRSFFRTIANLDIKLDFVPPALINFIARQLIGSGFKLYKKKVASANDDASFQEALKDPLYTRVREALYREDSPVLRNVEEEEEEEEEEPSEAFQESTTNEDSQHENCIADSVAMDIDTNRKANEIEEFEEKGSNEGVQKQHDNITHEITEEVRTDKMEVNANVVRQSQEIKEQFACDIKTKVCISPEVERALGTLEMAINMIREYNSSPIHLQSNVNTGGFPCSESDAMKEATLKEGDEMRKDKHAHVESSKLGSSEMVVRTARISSDNHGSRRSNSSTRETKQSKIAPASLDGTSPSSLNQRSISIVGENSSKGNNLVSGEANSVKGKRKYLKLRLCCSGFSSDKVD